MWPLRGRREGGKGVFRGVNNSFLFPLTSVSACAKMADMGHTTTSRYKVYQAIARSRDGVIQAIAEAGDRRILRKMLRQDTATFCPGCRIRVTVRRIWV